MFKSQRNVENTKCVSENKGLSVMTPHYAASRILIILLYLVKSF